MAKANDNKDFPAHETKGGDSNNKNFFEWLKSKNESGEKVLSIVVLSIELLLVFWDTTKGFAIPITLVLNLVFLGYFIFKFNREYRVPFTTKNFNQLSEFKAIPFLNKFKFWRFERRANNSIKQFRVFEGFLYSTAILYLVIIVVKAENFFVKDFSTYTHIIKFQLWFAYLSSLLTHMFSYAGAIFILKCFYIMYFPTSTDREMDKKRKAASHFWFWLIFLLLIESILTLPLDTVPGFKLRTFYFELACSIINAVALILLFARFESRLLGIQPAVTLVLYVYAVIQVALPFVTGSITNLFFEKSEHAIEKESHDILITLILVLCLFGKVVFFNIVVYLYKTKRLFYYFIKTAINYEMEETNWCEFQKNTFESNRMV